MPISPFVFGSSETEANKREDELARSGPMLAVVVSAIGTKASSELTGMYADAPRQMTALVDTGASVNVIDNRTARRIGLPITDYAMMASARGAGMTPIYAASLTVLGLGQAVRGYLYGGDLATRAGEYRVLLGRGFLKDFLLTYDGPDGRCYLVHRDGKPGPVSP